MKKIIFASILTLTLSASAQEADFSGFYGGIQIGNNQSESSGLQNLSQSSTYPGLVGGYSFVTNGKLLAVEGFTNYHNKSITYKDAGVGLKAGKVFGNILVYGRLAVTGSWPSYRPQLGLGTEYKLDSNFALTALASHDQTTDDGIKRQNTNVTVGLNYYFH